MDCPRARRRFTRSGRIPSRSIAIPIELRCPVRGCGRPLARDARRLACEAGHSFDVAKSGYVNLLQPQDRRSSSPGDTGEAVRARRRLVDRDVESVLHRDLARFAAEGLSGRSGLLLDAGCGEGSVTRLLADATGLEAVGVDISVAAIERAARTFPHGTWIVANADRALPFPDGAFACVASVTSRRNPLEFRRILSPDGLVLVVVPGADDLRELRAVVLGAPGGRDRVASVMAEFAGEFECVGQREIRGSATLDRASIDDVLASTYRGARHAQRARADAIASLDVTLSREAFLFRPRPA